MPLSDTPPEMVEKQFEILRKMTGEQRLSIAIEMSLFARDLLKEALRREHPDWSDAQVIREVLRLALLPQPLPERL
jgi:hypothetical protein